MDVIDANWIKRHRTGRHGELKELADAVGIEPDKITKILNGSRQVKAHEAPRIAAFFMKAEGFAEKATAYASQATPINATARVRTLVAALCPDLPNAEVYRVRVSAIAAGILAGDLLVVQLGADAHPGDLVVTTIAEPDADTQTTLIRRFWPPLIVPVSQDDPFPAMVPGETQSSAIVACVKAVARGGAAA
ncbi:MAG: hypothetical protein NW217_01570 [Hyphomicrobiaceae bacterium]|nr:hypothetical protein [Hyphomicrobiaceae bacterium]